MLKKFTAAAASATLLLSGTAFAKDDWFPSTHGKDDQAGQSNLMTPDRVKAAMGLIKQGKVISLARTYSDKMPLFGHRSFATPALGRHGRDRKQPQQTPCYCWKCLGS